MNTTRATYGLDAPGVVRGLFLGSTGALAAGLVALAGLAHRAPGLAAALGQMSLWMSGSLLITGLLMVRSSYRGKFRERDRLLDALTLRGNEQVLDVGCGRGLLLIGAASRLSGGRVVGLDLWQAQDQSGNSPRATQANAEAEGVTAQVRIAGGDARRLPFRDSSFDVVVSSLALHNIYDPAERETALCEIARVLKPGGRAALLDISHTHQYAQVLRTNGMANVRLSGMRFWVFPPARVVTANKEQA